MLYILMFCVVGRQVRDGGAYMVVQEAYLGPTPTVIWAYI